MAFSFYFLVRDRATRDRIRDAISPAFGKTIPGEFCNNDLQSIEYIEAFINEAMRVQSPVLYGGVRTTGSQGLEVDGVWIPPAVTVYTSINNYHRSKPSSATLRVLADMLR